MHMHEPKVCFFALRLLGGPPHLVHLILSSQSVGKVSAVWWVGVLNTSAFSLLKNAILKDTDIGEHWRSQDIILKEGNESVITRYAWFTG